MTFREALEREIAAQGLSVTEIARISGVSKGAVYNILNCTTEESRIRPSTRRAIARGCNRDLQVLEDGGVFFVERREAHPPESPSEVALRLVPGRPFLETRFFKEPFDWLYELEEKGALLGLGTVDRVFQKREDFLSLVVENNGGSEIREVQFELRVGFANGGPEGRFASRLPVQVPPGARAEGTLFLLGDPAYRLELLDPVYTDSDGQRRGIYGHFQFIHKG